MSRPCRSLDRAVMIEIKRPGPPQSDLDQGVEPANAL